MPPTKVFKCSGCGENIGKSQASIQCSACKLWLHVPCSGVTEKDLAVLKGIKQFSFSCSTCCMYSRAPGTDTTVNNEISSLRSVIDTFINKVETDQASAKNDLSNLNFKIDQFITKVDNEQCSIKQALADTAASFRSDMASCLKEMKSEIIDCNKLIMHVDNSTTAKIIALEDQNYVLHRRLNRADIVISGLPIGIENLIDPIIKIGSYHNIPITNNDINHVCYINKRRSVLVKFNSVFLRDNIMNAYFKSRSLKVRDVVEGNIDLRIYLNDHYGPAAGKLNAICRKLLERKVITKYRILNGDKLQVKLTKTDGNDVVHSIAECNSLLNSNV